MSPQDLIVKESIKQVKYRYLRCLDQKDFPELETTLTSDATASYGGGAYDFVGRDAIMQFLHTTMASQEVLSSHRCTQPEIEIHDPLNASGTWALIDTVILTKLDLIVHGAAFYSDRYRLEADGWRICHTGYKRTYEQVLPRQSIAGLTLTASWWGTDGRSTLPAG